MTPGEQPDTAAAARLMEALMTDAHLRDRFRRDPVGTCRAAGLDDLADEMAAGSGKAMQTLDLRESKSSLAGVLMAAAVEGMAVWQLVEHAGDVGDAVADMLSQVQLPAIPDPHGGGGGGAVAPALAVVDGDDPAGAGGGADATDMAAVTGDPGGSSDAEAEAPAAAAKAPAPAPAVSAAEPAAVPPAAASEPATPAATTPPESGAPDAAPTTPGDVAAPAEAATSSGPAPQAVTDLLASDRLTADEPLERALQDGSLGGTAPAALQAAIDRAPVEARLSGDGRAIEIVAVDGAPVDDANVAARDLAEALGDLKGDARPRSIGTPWSIGAPGFTTGPKVGDRLRLELVAPAAAASAPAPAAPEPAPAAPTPSEPVATPAAAADPVEPAEPAARADTRTPGRSDTLTLAVPTAERAAATPDRNASLSLPAISDPNAERAAAPTDAAADGIGALSPTDYPGDDASQAQLAAWMGALAQQRGLPAELPVMAALVESGVKNLNYGDRDSVGFFQMRTSIWDKGEYAGYAHKPELQVKWFLDTAEDMRKNARSITDPKQFGEWIADIERPAEQYRWKYGARLEEAQRLLRQAGGSTQSAAGAAAATPVADPAPASSSQAEPAGGGRAAESATAAPSSPEELAKAAGKAALANDRLHFDDVGVADLKAGRIDPRILAVLHDLSKKHEISVSCMRSDHSKFTAGGSISNHFEGRGVDIATVDGERVEPGSPAARTLAARIAGMDADYRPDEVGTPWALSAPGHFTDAAHQDHIHIAFKSELSGSWTPPAGVLGEPVAERAAAAGPAPTVPGVAGVAAESARSDTLSLPAIADRQSQGAADRNASMQLPAIKDERAVPSAAGAPAEGAAVPSAGAGEAAAAGPVDPAAAGSAADAVQAAASAPAAAGPRALGAVAEAKKYLGTPYLWGGSSPKTGFDCSGLVQWAYAQQGIKIPRVTYDQIDAPNATKVGREDLRPGDLVFFSTAAGDVHHVGMSLGGDKFIHAPHTGDVVKYSSLKEPYYAGQFAGGRRFDRAAPVAPAAGAPSGAEPVAQRAALVAAGDAGAAAGPDAGAVEAAEAARVRDAEALRDPNSMVFRALSEQEAVGHRSTMQFLAAVKPKEAERLADAAAQAGIDTAAAIPQGAVGYPGDDAGREALAKWLASQARKHGLPPELPVMAALVESNVQNLNYGDRDSVGFFQMRTGIWDQGEYAGYSRKPELQAKWFIDHALAVKRSRLAAGHEDFGRDPSSWGEWIADVERPAEQYRGRYQLRLAEARRLLGR